jgi:hypothetical protein
MRLYFLFIGSLNLLYMFRALLAHLQECRKLFFIAAYVAVMFQCVVRWCDLVYLLLLWLLLGCQVWPGVVFRFLCGCCSALCVLYLWVL